MGDCTATRQISEKLATKMAKRGKNLPCDLVFPILTAFLIQMKVYTTQNTKFLDEASESWVPKQRSDVIGWRSRASGHLLGAFLSLLSERSWDIPNVSQHLANNGLGMSRSYP